jgi:hypothetical protein
MHIYCKLCRIMLKKGKRLSLFYKNAGDIGGG